MGVRGALRYTSSALRRLAADSGSEEEHHRHRRQGGACLGDGETAGRRRFEVERQRRLEPGAEVVDGRRLPRSGLRVDK
jgi:hypothetical protein